MNLSVACGSGHCLSCMGKMKAAGIHNLLNGLLCSGMGQFGACFGEGESQSHVSPNVSGPQACQSSGFREGHLDI